MVFDAKMATKAFLYTYDIYVHLYDHVCIIQRRFTEVHGVTVRKALFGIDGAPKLL